MDVLDLVFQEMKAGETKHRKFASYHEAYAVLLEEVDELWDEIKKQTPSLDALAKEAIQVAAVAARIAARAAANEPIE